MRSCAHGEIRIRPCVADCWSPATDGLEDLLANLEAIQIHMPGVRLSREGVVRLSHGTAIARWTATREGGETLGRGTNVYDLSSDGRIARVVGFWEA